jgi:hypothetical protein
VSLRRFAKPVMSSEMYPVPEVCCGLDGSEWFIPMGRISGAEESGARPILRVEGMSELGGSV